MKRFVFRLQTLLDIREAREKEIKNELAGLLQKQNAERAKQESLRRGIEENRRKFGERFRKGDYDSFDAVMFERYIDVSYKAISAAEDRIQAMEPEIQKVRIRLVEASKARKVVEKLKERKRAEHQYEMNREIAKENDDMNQKIFYKKSIQQSREVVND